jgi:hypothetical protein
MGCASSCKIFETFSTALQWIATHKLGITHMVKILDDFLILNRSKVECASQLRAFLAMCEDIGIPMAIDKTFAPDTTMIFVGYELDSIMMEVHMPVDKLEKARSLISQFLQTDRHKIQLRELQSIIGFHNFTCAVVRPGRAFLRRLIDLTIGVRKPFYSIRITAQARQDLRTWLHFLESFNGRSLFLPNRWITSPSLHLYTDASGTLGYGAVLGNAWFWGTWDGSWRNQNITLLEFYPIVLSIQVWGHLFANKCLVFHTDNLALVSVINSQTSKEPRVMHLVRELVLSSMNHNILFRAQHIAGIRNVLADSLSRLQVELFQQLHPAADPAPTPIPPLPSLPK